MNKPITVAVADDHMILRKGIISLLSEFKEISVLFEAENGKALMSVLKHTQPDIVLLDINMPEMSGSEALKLIKVKFPNVKVIMFSMFFDNATVTEFIKQGANGFLSKNCDVELLICTIKTVHEKQFYFQHGISHEIIKALSRSGHLKDKSTELTAREAEILQLVCAGKSHKEIADKLFITLRTVDFHKANIYKKTNTNCNVSLYRYAVDAGMFIHNELSTKGK